MTNTFTKLWGSAMLLCLACTVQAQVIITCTFAGNNNGIGQNANIPNGIEIFATTDIPDLSAYSIHSGVSSYTFPNIIVPAGEFLYFADNATHFYNFFGMNPDGVSSLFTRLNGNTSNDFIIEDSNQNSLDYAPGDGFQNGWAYRLDNTGPDSGGLITDNWDINSGALANCNGGNNNCPNAFPIGTYQLTSMPVELVEFKVNKQNDEAFIQWTTASEENNAYFEVQRAGADMRFETIASLEGQVNSTVLNTYQYADITPFEGMNYYRLVQVDLDGTTTVLPTRALDFTSQDKIICYPNPASDVLNIQGVQKGATYTLRNVTGVLVQSGLFTGDQISITTLPVGMYWLSVQQESTTITKPLETNRLSSISMTMMTMMTMFPWISNLSRADRTIRTVSFLCVVCWNGNKVQ